MNFSILFVENRLFNIDNTGNDGSCTAIFRLGPISNCMFLRQINVHVRRILLNKCDYEEQYWLPEDEKYHIVHHLKQKLQRVLSLDLCKLYEQFPS